MEIQGVVKGEGEKERRDMSWIYDTREEASGNHWGWGRVELWVPVWWWRIEDGEEMSSQGASES